MKTRVLSLICAVCLLLGALPSAAALSGEERRAADTLYTLGLLEQEPADLAAPATRGDGVTLLEKSSALSTFTYETNAPGAYQLSVAVTDRMGAVARGVSAVLYIAEQTLDMTVPSTLAAGEDLVILVSAVEGATRYCIIVTNVETKETVLFNTMTRADSRTVYGYALEAGAYRVAGYVFGDDIAEKFLVHHSFDLICRAHKVVTDGFEFPF